MQFYSNNMQSMEYAVKNMTLILMLNYHSSMFIIQYVVYCVHVCDRYTTRVRCPEIICYVINCAVHDIIIILVTITRRTYQ